MHEEKYADLIWDHDEAAHKKFIENLAPIVLFTYNRLEHTQKTIEALKQNVYAGDSELYIYSDGPKNEEAKESVAAVRSFLRQVDGFKQVHIIERDKNWGLAENIMDGVTGIVNKYGKIIVLEDDIVTSKFFLKYMNDALEIYRDKEKVMSVNGYALPMEAEGLSETYFLKFADCWGWATWNRAWEHFERAPEKIMAEFSENDINAFNFENSVDYYRQVIDNHLGKLYTWAIFWYASVFKENGLGLMVRDSMSCNVGLDGSGEHCDADDAFVSKLSQEPITKFPMILEENIQGREKTKRFWFSRRKSLFQRILRKLQKIIRG